MPANCKSMAGGNLFSFPQEGPARTKRGHRAQAQNLNNFCEFGSYLSQNWQLTEVNSSKVRIILSAGARLIICVMCWLAARTFGCQQCQVAFGAPRVSHVWITSFYLQNTPLLLLKYAPHPIALPIHTLYRDITWRCGPGDQVGE